LEIIDEYGADALRFANAAMASLGGVLKLDTQRIAGYRNFGTKLWNACRFAEMNGVWEGHATGPAPARKATANRWIIGETAKTLAEVNAALENFRFDQAADALYKFVWGKVCDWYVEFAKPLFDGEACGRNPGDHGLGAGPVDDPAAPLHALHHRGALGHHRQARETAGPHRLADLGASLIDPGPRRK
jgi:valyl-tRNA synthetase